MKKTALPGVLLASSLLVLALLSGCFSAGNGKNVKEIRTIMEAYLSERGGTWSIGSVTADVDRPAPDRLEETDYGHGDFTLNGERYVFSVNRATGEVYTSEHAAEFRERFPLAVLRRLELDPADCVWVGSYSLTQSGDDDSGPGQSHYVGTLPPEIPDMDAFMEQALEGTEIGELVYLVCRGVALTSDSWSPSALAGWENVKVCICAFPDPDALLPDAEDLGYSYWHSFPGERAELTTEEFVLLPAE